jgi:hypothetical protein
MAGNWVSGQPAGERRAVASQAQRRVPFSMSPSPRITRSTAVTDVPKLGGVRPRQVSASSDRRPPPFHLAKIDVCLPPQGRTFGLALRSNRLGLTGGGTGFSLNGRV